MRLDIRLNNFLFKYLITLIVVFNFNECNSQLRQVCLVKDALIYGNYSYGIDLTDTSSIVQIIYDNKLFIDTTIVQFDQIGRIMHVKSPLEESWYSYGSNIINKKLKGNSEGLMNDNCYSIDYFLNKEGRIDNALVTTSTQKIYIEYYYCSIDNITRVEITDSLKISNRIEIFIYDSHSFEEWKTINSFGGLSLNYLRNNPSMEIITKVRNDTKIMYGILEPDLSKEITNPSNFFYVKNYQGDILATVTINRYNIE